MGLLLAATLTPQDQSRDDSDDRYAEGNADADGNFRHVFGRVKLCICGVRSGSGSIGDWEGLRKGPRGCGCSSRLEVCCCVAYEGEGRSAGLKND